MSSGRPRFAFAPRMRAIMTPPVATRRRLNHRRFWTRPHAECCGARHAHPPAHQLTHSSAHQLIHSLTHSRTARLTSCVTASLTRRNVMVVGGIWPAGGQARGTGALESGSGVEGTAWLGQAAAGGGSHRGAEAAKEGAKRRAE